MRPSGFFLTPPVDPLGDSGSPPGQLMAACQLLRSVVKGPGKGSQDSSRGLEKQLVSRGCTHCAGFVWSGPDFTFAKHFNMQ